MDQDHSLVKKLNISIDLVVYNTIIIDKIRVASSPLVDNLLRRTENPDSYSYKSVDQESSLFLTMDSQTSSPVGPAA